MKEWENQPGNFVANFPKNVKSGDLNFERENFFEQRFVSKVNKDSEIPAEGKKSGAFLVKNSIKGSKPKVDKKTAKQCYGETLSL